MRNSPISSVLMIVIVILGMFILVVMNNGMVAIDRDSSITLTASRKLLDTIIDEGEIPRSALIDFNADLASCAGTFTFEIQVAIPVLDSGGNTIYVYNTLDHTKLLTSKFPQGSIVTIEVTQATMNVYQRIMRAMPGMVSVESSCRLGGRVR